MNEEHNSRNIKVIAKTMTCKEVEDLMSDYLDGELSPIINRQIQLHIEHCSLCACLVDDLRTIIEMAKALRHEPMPEGARIRLHQALAKELNIDFPDLPRRSE